MIFIKLPIKIKIMSILFLPCLLWGLTINQKQQLYYPIGKKIYQKVCPKDRDIINFSQEELLSKHPCGKLNKIESLSLFIYLHDKIGKNSVKKEKILFHKKDKCPVCGMFVYKYPRWIAQIVIKNKRFSFDGVKDMMKFYFNPDDYSKIQSSELKKKSTKILVYDYYTQEVIDGKKAYFVINSDVLGPMGNELIPFKTFAEAKNFKKEHFGKKILKFDELSDDIVWSLDE